MILIEGDQAAALAYTMARAMAPRGVVIEARLSLSDDDAQVVAGLLESVGLTWRAPDAPQGEADEVWTFEREEPIDVVAREEIRATLKTWMRRMREDERE